MFQPKNIFPPGYVSKSQQERERRLALLDSDPDKLEQDALENTITEMNGGRFEE
jgi:hypothetical protein